MGAWQVAARTQGRRAVTARSRILGRAERGASACASVPERRQRQGPGAPEPRSANLCISAAPAGESRGELAR